MIREILLLGNPKLYEISAEVTEADVPQTTGWVTDLHDTLIEYRKVHGAGRADIRYLDAGMQPQAMHLEGDYSELLQHEYDHLDGILATMRAVDNKSFYLRQMKRKF
jgi:peptide deformylase